MKRSAGVLLRRADGHVLLVHPGGPFWARKDLGAWSIPKGEHDEGEDPLAHALREFEEEMGSPAPDGPVVALGEFRQSGGKVVTVFAREGDLDATAIRSNHFTVEWPPRSGRFLSFPEIDRAEWFPVDLAREKLNPAQADLLDRLP